MIIRKDRPEGNAYAVIGAVQNLLKQAGRQAEWPAIRARMMEGDYDNLCAVAKEVTFGSIEVR
jgi:hypothetical protein